MRTLAPDQTTQRDQNKISDISRKKRMLKTGLVLPRQMIPTAKSLIFSATSMVYTLRLSPSYR
jgi:hypothetical protein